MVITTKTGSLRRELNAEETKDVELWLSVNPLCVRASTLGTKAKPREQFLSILKWYDYDARLSDKQLSALKRIYKYRDTAIERQLEKQRLGSS